MKRFLLNKKYITKGRKWNQIIFSIFNSWWWSWCDENIRTWGWAQIPFLPQHGNNLICLEEKREKGTTQLFIHETLEYCYIELLVGLVWNCLRHIAICIKKEKMRGIKREALDDKYWLIAIFQLVKGSKRFDT